MGMTGFDSYGGDPSMYKVHKFMHLGNAEVTYFITQVGMAAASFGVAKDDITAVAKALNDTFNMECSPAAEVIPGTGAQLQAICTGDGCTKSANATCDKYDANVMMPGMCSMASGTGSMMPTGSMSTMMPSGTGPASVPSDNAAASNSFGAAAAVAAAAAYFL